MIIEPGQIQHEIARVVGDEGYLPLRNQDFTDICPNPSWGIHVCAQSVDALIVLSRICLEQVLVSKKELKSIIVYIRGSSLTMNDISKIDGMTPHAQRFKRGLGRKYAQGIDIWFFAEEVQENDTPAV
jgi:hypothetical protein